VKLMTEVLHCLHDTIVLLGGDRRIAELLNHPELITSQDVADLRRYTSQLLEATKAKLVCVNAKSITTNTSNS